MSILSRYQIFLFFLVPIFCPAQPLTLGNEKNPESFLEAILTHLGLTAQDIQIIASEQISNARAEVRNGIRYIYYNEGWIKSIDSSYKDSGYWLKMGVITHEIGHHLKGHTITDGNPTTKMELEADWWSGFTMRKLGATEKEALSAVQSMAPVFDAGIHPKRAEREKAIKNGYKSAHFPSDDDEYNAPQVDNFPFATKQFIGLNWTVENLDIDVGEGSWFYDNDDKHGPRYGRLYTFEAAKKACKNLGNGWRLPRQSEWEALALEFGGYVKSIPKKPGKRSKRKQKGKDIKGSYLGLVFSGHAGFEAELGGWRNGSIFKGITQEGFYWTDDTPYGYDLEQAIRIEFDKKYSSIFLTYAKQSLGFSCRCVRD